jgi:hypothetical protein
VQWDLEIREFFCSDLAEDHYDQPKHPFDILQRLIDWNRKKSLKMLHDRDIGGYD